MIVERNGIMGDRPSMGMKFEVLSNTKFALFWSQHQENALNIEIIEAKLRSVGFNELSSRSNAIAH